MVHGGGVIGNSGMPCDHDGVRHQAGVRLRHQGRVALEEAALVFRQTADAVDMLFHLLPRPGVKRGLWKAYLLPLRMLTTHRNPPANPVSEKAETPSESSVRLVLTSTTFPFTFTVSHLGKVIWQGDSSGESIEKEVGLNFPPEGIDLSLEVKWRGEKTTAVKLAVTPKEGEPITRTIWGTRSASDVLTFAEQ